MNRRQFLSQAGYGTTGLALGASGVGGVAAGIAELVNPNTTYAQSRNSVVNSEKGQKPIQSHSIGKAYGITVDQLMKHIDNETFLVIVNGKPLQIKTRRILQRVLDANLVYRVGTEEYNRAAQMEVRLAGGTLQKKIGLDGKLAEYYINYGVDETIVTITNMLSGSLVPEVKHNSEGNMQFSQRGIAKDTDNSGVILDLADRTFPAELRQRRNGSGRILIDRIEANILSNAYFIALTQEIDDTLKQK